jgi:hypothetical protein
MTYIHFVPIERSTVDDFVAVKASKINKRVLRERVRREMSDDFQHWNNEQQRNMLSLDLARSKLGDEFRNLKRYDEPLDAYSFGATILSRE